MLSGHYGTDSDRLLCRAWPWRCDGLCADTWEELNRIRISKRHRATCDWAGYLKQRGARSDAALELYLKPNRSWWRNEVDIMESGGGATVRDITFAAAGSNLAQKLDLETRPDSSFMRHAPSRRQKRFKAWA